MDTARINAIRQSSESQSLGTGRRCSCASWQHSYVRDTEVNDSAACSVLQLRLHDKEIPCFQL